MFIEFVGGLVVKALDGSLFTGAVQALDLPVSPGMGRFGQAVFHTVLPADAVKTVPTRQEVVWLGCTRHAVISQYRMPFIGELVAHAPQQFSGDDPFGLRMQLGKRDFAGAVNGPKEVLAALLSLYLREMDVQIADGLLFEFLFWRAPPVFVQGQAAAAVALKTAVRRRGRQVRNRSL